MSDEHETIEESVQHTADDLLYLVVNAPKIILTLVLLPYYLLVWVWRAIRRAG